MLLAVNQRCEEYSFKCVGYYFDLALRKITNRSVLMHLCILILEIPDESRSQHEPRLRDSGSSARCFCGEKTRVEVDFRELRKVNRPGCERIDIKHLRGLVVIRGSRRKVSHE